MLATLASLLILAGDAPASQPVEEAATLARRSMTEYDGGEFVKALEDVERAYDLDPRPELLFNLGQCHRALGHWQKAEFFYRGFLRQRPDTEARAKVEKLIAKMVAKQQEEAAPHEPAPALILTPQPPPPVEQTAPVVVARLGPPLRWPQRIPLGAWITAGVGVACLGTGIGFGATAAVTQGLDHTSPGGGGRTDHTLALSSLQRANTDAKVADGLLIAGGVLALAAITWALVAPNRGPSSPPGVINF